jgi:uncharacterized membrane-anchored protein YhcB (DUF1043 family)
MTGVQVSFLIGAVIGFVIGALVMRKHYARVKAAEETLKGVKL